MKNFWGILTALLVGVGAVICVAVAEKTIFGLALLPFQLESIEAKCDHIIEALKTQKREAS